LATRKQEVRRVGGVQRLAAFALRREASPSFEDLLRSDAERIGQSTRPRRRPIEEASLEEHPPLGPSLLPSAGD
jgi:hypothetical protein